VFLIQLMQFLELIFQQPTSNSQVNSRQGVVLYASNNISTVIREATQPMLDKIFSTN